MNSKCIEFLYHHHGKEVSQAEFEQLCITPLIGTRRTKQCMTLIKYQLFCVWMYSDCASVIVHYEASGSGEYIYLSDYKIRVFFHLIEDKCDIYGAAG